VLTDWLLDHPWASPAVLAALVVLGPLVGSWLAGRRRLTAWLAGAALLPVALLTLLPVDSGTGLVRCTVQWALPTLGRVELLANLLLFVPPALLATVATRRPLVVLVGGSLLSAVVEASQALVVGIGRACDTTDWLCNTLGVGLGVLLGIAALALHRRGRPAPPGRRRLSPAAPAAPPAPGRTSAP
jgi:hypothetical protein